MKAWLERLSAGLSRSIQASTQTIGHLEEEILHQTHELDRRCWKQRRSKKPVGQVSAVIEHLCVVKLLWATLEREARRQGQRAEDQRRQRDKQMSAGTGGGQVVPELKLAAPMEPFTLVIELDAWNIRERNAEAWVHTEQLRQGGKEPEWWHWVLWRHLFSIEPARAIGGRTFAHLEPGHSDDLRRPGRPQAADMGRATLHGLRLA